MDQSDDLRGLVNTLLTRLGKTGDVVKILLETASDILANMDAGAVAPEDIAKRLDAVLQKERSHVEPLAKNSIQKTIDMLYQAKIVVLENQDAERKAEYKQKLEEVARDERVRNELLKEREHDFDKRDNDLGIAHAAKMLQLQNLIDSGVADKTQRLDAEYKQMVQDQNDEYIQTVTDKTAQLDADYQSKTNELEAKYRSRCTQLEAEFQSKSTQLEAENKDKCAARIAKLQEVYNSKVQLKSEHLDKEYEARKAELRDEHKSKEAALKTQQTSLEQHWAQLARDNQTLHEMRKLLDEQQKTWQADREKWHQGIQDQLRDVTASIDTVSNSAADKTTLAGVSEAVAHMTTSIDGMTANSDQILGHVTTVQEKLDASFRHGLLELQTQSNALHQEIKSMMTNQSDVLDALKSAFKIASDDIGKVIEANRSSVDNALKNLASTVPEVLQTTLASTVPEVLKTTLAETEAGLRNATAKMEAALVQVNQQTIAHSEAMAALNKQLAEKERQVGEQMRQLTARDQQLAEKEQQLRETMRQLTARDQQLAEKEQQLREKMQHLTARDQQLTENERQLGEQLQQLADRDQKLAEKEQQLVDKTQQLSEKDQQIANLSKRHAEEAPGPAAKRAQLDEEADEWQAKVNALVDRLPRLLRKMQPRILPETGLDYADLLKASGWFLCRERYADQIEAFLDAQEPADQWHCWSNILHGYPGEECSCPEDKQCIQIKKEGSGHLFGWFGVGEGLRASWGGGEEGI